MRWDLLLAFCVGLPIGAVLGVVSLFSFVTNALTKAESDDYR